MTLGPISSRSEVQVSSGYKSPGVPIMAQVGLMRRMTGARDELRRSRSEDMAERTFPCAGSGDGRRAITYLANFPMRHLQAELKLDEPSIQLIF